MYKFIGNLLGQGRLQQRSTPHLLLESTNFTSTSMATIKAIPQISGKMITALVLSITGYLSLLCPTPSAIAAEGPYCQFVPEEVAAKVVTAEVNRDGVFEVTLIKDPVAVEEDGTLSYILNYLSSGKRGDKRFVAKFSIQNQRLYALTGQVLEADYKNKEEEIMTAISSFRVLPL